MGWDRTVPELCLEALVCAGLVLSSSFFFLSHSLIVPPFFRRRWEGNCNYIAYTNSLIYLATGAVSLQGKSPAWKKSSATRTISIVLMALMSYRRRTKLKSKKQLRGAMLLMRIGEGWVTHCYTSRWWDVIADVYIPRTYRMLKWIDQVNLASESERARRRSVTYHLSISLNWSILANSCTTF